MLSGIGTCLRLSAPRRVFLVTLISSIYFARPTAVKFYAAPAARISARAVIYLYAGKINWSVSLKGFLIQLFRLNWKAFFDAFRRIGSASGLFHYFKRRLL